MAEEGDLETLPKWVKPDVSFKVYFNDGNPNNKRWHVRGIVDNHAVCRRWSARKQRYAYELLDPVYFQSYRAYITRGKDKR